MKKFENWKVEEDRRWINDENYSSSYDLFFYDYLITSYGKRKYALEVIKNLKNGIFTDEVKCCLVDVLSNELEDKSELRFTLGDSLFDIFESVEGGYIYNIYPNDPNLIFDEDEELIEDEQLDGGLCTGTAKDVFSFII